ncbi:hypothetical protein T265_11996 [Opisthorchis viverrini]|uniref:Uncharacterized protein n=1 Tax=Opisthorchis viverrini TaxID=6198 RepID=A0A074YWH5_OPIVI|nr:hypothetical protein T265_11996 [Opisthorchis viverrini]KER19116.1 hypothetical protein T265_11996 [Opisthorchis viverrini]
MISCEAECTNLDGAGEYEETCDIESVHTLDRVHPQGFTHKHTHVLPNPNDERIGNYLDRDA